MIEFDVGKRSKANNARDRRDFFSLQRGVWYEEHECQQYMDNHNLQGRVEHVALFLPAAFA